jgi:hypothetical protein
MSDAAAPSRLALFTIAGCVGLALVGTAALWVRYGSAVFFEVLRAGFVACFG